MNLSESRGMICTGIEMISNPERILTSIFYEIKFIPFLSSFGSPPMPEGLRKGCSANQTELCAPERLTKAQKEASLTPFQIHMDVLT